ncbi:SRPBCC family protein [Winogradskya humida]|uniref:Activator of Hsp90 ATPase-like protein n=1 Tax=Winogradskya humida TaxID=113566 RepID=A0ABQ3ZHE2_9ACTN|nr:SRPBCC domain-containing protein [Actinoplanes humidus]GIE18006.1 hypothetical protein Ahu01nite_011080 [Actinoplanes humidus]
MGKEFETRLEAEVPAGPEQVWQAIATGPGISSWFVGRTEVDGDTVRTSFGDDWMPAGTVSVVEPGRRFAYSSAPGPDGRFVAYEYLVEGVDRGSTVVRAVTSGFLPGEDWAGEYEAMRSGTEMFFRTLVEYLRFFPGRAATPVTIFGPPVDDWPRAWGRVHEALGLRGAVRAGDPVPGGGVVYFTNAHSLGVRTADGLWRVLRGMHGAMIASHAAFGPVDSDRWRLLLEKSGS